MEKVDSCYWIGKSGKAYTYQIYELPQDFLKNQDGNYIYARKERRGWKPIYVGQGDINLKSGPDHPKAVCIALNGATHIHVHLNPDKSERVAEERDILGKHVSAYTPDGCNEKMGGWLRYEDSTNLNKVDE